VTIRAVADTHTVLWYLYDDPRLSQAAEELMDAIDAAGDQIAVSSIALAEMIYLTEKGRIAAEALERVLTALDQPDATLVDVPFDRTIAEEMQHVERSQVPELPDRIVAATGLHLGVPVISRDHKIRSSIVTTVW
jgi:PIN domain nuclease of toxin-antitoxin system